jgi:hypothetical protein
LEVGYLGQHEKIELVNIRIKIIVVKVWDLGVCSSQGFRFESACIGSVHTEQSKDLPLSGPPSG